ncbi:exonuclease III protein [Polychytrium aggregatum]|uniref:exonuclease III protein n=1 Tax=Polychytrium aggregatum TaxID=110093 RepID=UPI0022FF39D7|nr:exonuclease III protein [Polychytrium aggregatum]KAI9203280.1 exonuclease III protein [Polychytrium aggregatum]
MSSSATPHRSQQTTSQRLDYIIVLDFEATCGPTVPKSDSEIIEFPMIVIDTQQRAATHEFQVYVKPTLHPILDDFCTELTGITQDQVDAGVSFVEALELAHDFVQPFVKQRNRSAILTCGDWDLKTMLPLQAEREAVPVVSPFDKWINIKKDFELVYKTRKAGMVPMLNHLGLTLEGRHHSGIDDCRNIARVALAMMDDGHVFGKPGTIRQRS